MLLRRRIGRINTLKFSVMVWCLGKANRMCYLASCSSWRWPFFSINCKFPIVIVSGKRVELLNRFSKCVLMGLRGALTNGSYIYPTLTNHTAFTANGSCGETEFFAPNYVNIFWAPSNTSTPATSQADSFLEDGRGCVRIDFAIFVIGVVSLLLWTLSTIA
jgi:hypothetical protein